MAVKNNQRNSRHASLPASSRSDDAHASVIALAEQVGRVLGTVSAKTEGRLDRNAISRAVAQIRDTAAEFLEQVNAMNPLRPAEAETAPAGARRPSRGPVDAPGKKHRPPPPGQRVPKHMTSPVGRQNVRASAKAGRRGVR